MVRRRCTNCGRRHLLIPWVAFLGRCCECGREVCRSCGTYIHAVVHHDCWRRVARHLDEDDLLWELLRRLPR